MDYSPVRMARAAVAMEISKVNLQTQADDPAITTICSASIADSEDGDHGIVLLKFVRALARRQARLDIRLAFDVANDNKKRILH